MAASQVYIFDGTDWLPWDGVIEAVTTITDPITVESITDPVVTRPQAILTTGPDVFQDLRVASAANLGGTSAVQPGGALIGARPSEWIAFSDPGAALQSVATQIAVAGRSHVVTGISACVLAVNAQPGLTLQLLSAAVVIASWKFPIPPAGQGRDLTFSLNTLIATNTAVALQFSAAPAAGNFQSTVMTGYTIA